MSSEGGSLISSHSKPGRSDCHHWAREFSHPDRLASRRGMVQGSLPSTARVKKRKGQSQFGCFLKRYGKEGGLGGLPTYHLVDRAFSGFCSWLFEDQFERSRRIESFPPQSLIQPSPAHTLWPTWETLALSPRFRFVEGRARQGCH